MYHRELAAEFPTSILEMMHLQGVGPKTAARLYRELREARGEIEAAEARALPSLLDRSRLRGDLHMHTTESDGRDTVETMVNAAADAGLEYIAITDHSQSLAMANGLDERRALAHAARVRVMDGHRGVRVLAGIECDILPDGTMDLQRRALTAGPGHHAVGRDDRQTGLARTDRRVEHTSFR